MISQLDSTTLLTNDIDSQNQSVVRGLAGKKLLKAKLRGYKQEVASLKLTLKVMQDKLDAHEPAYESVARSIPRAGERPDNLLSLLLLQAQALESQLIL
mmetsp:Transcript_24130/g.18395  ORF Transcript_24130/g.18395 Transcript_24130/m.18395 type:complete len:99 (-) Transcript_24130:30-326(-)